MVQTGVFWVENSRLVFGLIMNIPVCNELSVIMCCCFTITKENKMMNITFISNVITHYATLCDHVPSVIYIYIQYVNKVISHEDTIA